MFVVEKVAKAFPSLISACIIGHPIWGMWGTSCFWCHTKGSFAPLQVRSYRMRRFFHWRQQICMDLYHDSFCLCYFPTFPRSSAKPFLSAEVVGFWPCGSHFNCAEQRNVGISSFLFIDAISGNNWIGSIYCSSTQTWNQTEMYFVFLLDTDNNIILYRHECDWHDIRMPLSLQKEFADDRHSGIELAQAGTRFHLNFSLIFQVAWWTFQATSFGCISL